MQQQIFGSIDNILPHDGHVSLAASFFSTQESKVLFGALLNEIEWKHEAIKIYGKTIMQPRLTAWYADEGKSYGYSGIKMEPKAWNEPLLFIKNKIENHAGVSFNSVLLNQYRSGQDSMGWHRDNEPELGQNPTIASVSFGGTRSFQLRHYFDKTIKRQIELTDGSFLLMKNETQHFWEHQIPKTARAVAPRINLTFRFIL